MCFKRMPLLRIFQVLLLLSFAVRLGEFDIPVYEVRPGVIYTDMTSGVKEKYDKLIDEGLCVQKRFHDS